MLTTVDWVADFRFLWASTIGTRMLLPGFVLLLTEVLVMMHQRSQRKRETCVAA